MTDQPGRVLTPTTDQRLAALDYNFSLPEDRERARQDAERWLLEADTRRARAEYLLSLLSAPASTSTTESL